MRISRSHEGWIAQEVDGDVSELSGTLAELRGWLEEMIQDHGEAAMFQLMLTMVIPSTACSGLLNRVK